MTAATTSAARAYAEPVSAPAPDRAGTVAHFDALHQAYADPWGVSSRWYERRKRDLLLAALPRERYGLAFEPGCSVGGNTRALAARCDRVIAADSSAQALARAREWLQGCANVELQPWTLPRRWPDAPADLVVLSEVGYYLPLPDVDELLRSLPSHLAPGGQLLMCHWRAAHDDATLSGDALHDRAHAELSLAHVGGWRDADMRIDVWQAAGIAACLASVRRAVAQVAGEPVQVLVVLDRCSDGTEDIVRELGVAGLAVNARCVGAARAAGAEWLLARGARWLCCTDADSSVPPDWITAQLRYGADAVCGTIGVFDWLDHPPEVVEAFRAHYQDRDGHRHIHGANLGVSAAAYRRAGGFAPLTAHEDVRLVEALEAQAARIAWVCQPKVITSPRRIARAPEGFAAWLNARWLESAGAAAGLLAAPGQAIAAASAAAASPP